MLVTKFWGQAVKILSAAEVTTWLVNAEMGAA